MFILTTCNNVLTMVNPFANSQFGYPLLCAYVKEHQEGCKASIHSSNKKSKHTCCKF